MTVYLCWLTCVNKILQMDPTASASSSQKTSPKQDPADFHRLASEVSSQANVLAAHQQQLVKLTALTEELVRSVRALSSPSMAENQAPSPAAPAPVPPAVSSNLNQPKLSLPEKLAHLLPVRDFCCSAACILTSRHSPTPLMRAVFLSYAPYSPAELWSGLLHSGMEVSSLSPLMMSF